MAVMAIFTGTGFTKEMYEALRPVVRWESDPPAGGLVHACGFDSDGRLHVADVWESEEEMNAFVGQRLIPGFQQLGIPIPSVHVMPVHNLNIYPNTKRFLLR